MTIFLGCGFAASDGGLTQNWTAEKLVIVKFTTFVRLVVLSLIANCFVSCATPASRPRIKTVAETSKAELTQMFGPATKDYKVPGHENYEVVAFKPLFKNWSERVFLFKDGRYVAQASGQYPVEVRAMKNGEVSIVKIGKSLGPPIGEPRPKGGW